MKKGLVLGFTSIVVLGGAAAAAAIQLQPAPAPPESPTKIAEGECEVDIPALREQFPELTQMLLTVNFDGSDQVFRNPQQMVNYYVSEERVVEMMVSEGQRALRDGGTPERYSETRMKRLQQLSRQQLRRDIVEFRQQFDGPCKRLAWTALGGGNQDVSVIDETAATVAALPEENGR